MRMCGLWLIGIWLGGILASATPAQVFDERFEDWPSQLTIGGRLAIVPAPEQCRLLGELLDLETFSEAAWLVEDSSSLNEDQVSEAREHYATLLEDMRDVPGSQLVALPPAQAPELIVWYLPSVSPVGWDEPQTAPLREWLKGLLKSGKTLVLSGAGAAMAGKYLWANKESAEDTAGKQAGFDLFPDGIVHFNFDPSAHTRRLLSYLKVHPRCLGIGLESGTILLLEGRKLRVAGDRRAWLLLPRTTWLPSRVETIAARRGRSQAPTQWMADLTEWRRDAIDRTLEPFPPATPTPPRLDQGTLLIVGGGALPDSLMSRFVELAGGVDAAKLVYVPCAEEDHVPTTSSVIETWREMGVQHTALVHTKDRRQANSSDDVLTPLRSATGIWFGGGRQWNFADSYYGTQAHRLMKEVVQRGGVVGGSSAGASIQARYLARATPIENFRIMAPGYERGGLGFIDGVAIDQHFSQRKRQADMAALVERYPQLLGIGIDEATALEVRGDVAQVLGRGGVFFYNRQAVGSAPEPGYVRLEAGQQYNLVERVIVQHSE